MLPACSRLSVVDVQAPTISFGKTLMNFLFVTGLVTVTRHSYYCRLSLERENYLSPGAAPTRENKINSALCRGQARART
jgi:hypothetical protein